MKGYDPEWLADEDVTPIPAPQLDPMLQTEASVVSVAGAPPVARSPEPGPQSAPDTDTATAQASDPALRSKVLAQALITLSVRPGAARLDLVFAHYQDAEPRELGQAALALTAVLARTPVERRVDLVAVLTKALSTFARSALAGALRAQLGALVMTGPEPTPAPAPSVPPEEGSEP